MQRRHHQVGSINQRLIKLKQGQKTAFPFPLMVSPCLCKRQALLFLTPLFPSVFYPPTFCLPPCPNPVHLFALTYIATFTDFASPRSFICCSFFIWEQFYKCVLLPPCISFVDWLTVFSQHRPKDILYKIQNNMTWKNSRGFCPTSGGKFEKRAWQNGFYMLW